MLTLQELSLDWALQHALRYGDTDVFPIPFEYTAIEFDWANVKSSLAAENVLEWPTRPHRTLLSPKAKYAFRVITQLDPLDFILFAAIVKEVSDDLESRRVPVAEERVFSYRIQAAQDGQLFDPNIGYREFLARAQDKLDADPAIAIVATADISDFYSRIYHHRLERALESATTRTSHIKAITHFLSGWNGTETFGIPIGGAPSRILAEITLADVDEALLACGVDFIRFNDDYRIFASTKAEAYKHIAFLAETLYRNHGLSLQPQKTAVFDRDAFTNKFLSTPLDRELDSLHDRFEQLAAELGLNDWYEPIDYDGLSLDQQAAIDALNLVELFREELEKPEPDLPIVKFVLRRLGQLGDDSILDIVFENLDTLYPAFPDVMSYLKKLRYLNDTQRNTIGARVLDLLRGSILSELSYHRMWILDLFTYSNEWDNEGTFFNLYAAESDPVCRRKLILAMGRARQRHWFNSQWRSLFDHPHWPRRALLAAASCMPADSRRHWYRSVEPQLDPLERAVMRWAKQHPF